MRTARPTLAVARRSLETRARRRTTRVRSIETRAEDDDDDRVERRVQVCASKECGHLCCKVCWVNWLKMKKSCPVCKVPVSEDSIRGITFK